MNPARYKASPESFIRYIRGTRNLRPSDTRLPGFMAPGFVRAKQRAIRTIVDALRRLPS